MKIGILGKWGLGVGLVALPLTTNCLAEDQSPPPGQTNTVTRQESTNASPAKVDPSAAESTNVIDITEASVSPIPSEKTVPLSIHPTRPLAEIIKLANSGVEESVMMAFVTNSTSTFNLSAEEIIYLKDIGMPDRVVTAMILRDQTIRADSTTALAAAAPPPALEQPPVAPNAAEVAPQPDAMAAQYPPEPAPAPTEVADDSAFYGTLSPYGNWMNVAGYGPVWQPNVVVVNPGWAPYYNCGRWIWTDCGWYWCSDYSWGWAPFHYGRWFCHSRLGWCWAPGKVWGPSWVCWRYNNGYCGWAPLPPGTSYAFGVGLTFHGRPAASGQDFGLKAANYRFVAWNHFRERDFQHYRLPPQQHDQVFKNSVVAAKLSGDGHNVVNDGLPPQKVAAATGTQVRRIAIRDVAGTASSAGGTEHYDPNARTVTVYRPNFEQTSDAGSGGKLAVPQSSRSQAAPRSGVPSIPTRTPENLNEPTTGYVRTAPSQPAARPAQTAPLILRGPQNSGVKETPPASSLVIIGRKDPNGAQTFYQSTIPSASAHPASNTDVRSSPRPWTSSGAASPTPWADNEIARDAPNETWNQSAPAAANPGYRPWTYAPRSATPTYNYERPATTYRAPASAYQPAARSAPADVPRYAPPAGNTVQRSYAPPPAAPPARPAPQAQSAPAQSNSGRGQR